MFLPHALNMLGCGYSSPAVICNTMQSSQRASVSPCFQVIQLTLCSILAAALFGALHDQISYSVSPEYFTLLKFQQFHLTEWALPLRVKAALVGVFASWWMGIPLGLGLAVAATRWYGEHAAVAFWRLLPWLLAGCLLSALAGLGVGVWQTQDLTAFAHKRVPAGLIDLRSYLWVGFMHKGAYVGGSLALPLGMAWLYWRRPNRL